MSEVYDRIVKLLDERGSTRAKMCKELGIGYSTLTDLKNNRQAGLSAKKAALIADYLGVDVNYLVNGIKKQPDEDAELNEYLEMLRSRPECRMLLSTVRGATKEEVEANVRVIKALRGEQ